MTDPKPSDFRAVNRRGLLGCLATDTRGSTASLMAMAFIPVLLALGGGVDLGRGYVVKSQLQTAVDASALAAAQSCKTKNSGVSVIADPSDATVQAKAYFNENFTDAYMGTTNKQLIESEMCTGPNFMRVAVTGKATVPYSIMKIAGFKTKVIEATAVAETGSDPATIEAVMVLDVTGSMASPLSGTTRIASLRNAANDFVDIVYQGKETQPGIAVGMVPYNLMVNLGTFGTSRLNSLVKPLAGFTDQTGALGWAGCVKNDPTIKNMSSDLNVQDTGAWDIRKDVRGFDNTTAPLLDPFLYHPTWVRQSMTASADPANAFYQHAVTLNGGGFEDVRYRFSGDPATNTTIANSPAYRQFMFDRFIKLNDNAANMANDVVVTTSDGFYAQGSPATVAWKIRPEKVPNIDTPQYQNVESYGITNKDGRGPNTQCPSPIRQIAYGQTKSAHQNWINSNIDAFSLGGGTIHHTGMLWGYRMLQNTAAFPRTNPTIKKAKRVMLFMTDGNYEFANWYANSGLRARWGDAMSSAYGPVKDRMLRDSDNADDIKAASSLRFAKICQAAKNEGAVVYVVALAINDAGSDSMFSTCAPGDKYKKAASDQELREAFRTIARDVIDLHIVS